MYEGCMYVYIISTLYEVNMVKSSGSMVLPSEKGFPGVSLGS